MKIVSKKWLQYRIQHYPEIDQKRILSKDQKMEDDKRVSRSRFIDWKKHFQQKQILEGIGRGVGRTEVSVIHELAQLWREPILFQLIDERGIMRSKQHCWSFRTR